MSSVFHVLVGVQTLFADSTMLEIDRRHSRDEDLPQLAPSEETLPLPVG